MGRAQLFAMVLAVGALGIASWGYAADTDADYDLPLEGAVANPVWLQLPSADDMVRRYPPLAKALDIDGAALLRCKVTAQGGLQDCVAIREAPLGLGFGEAAMQMAPLFRMKPVAADGASVGGAEVQVPIKFVPPQAAPARSGATSATPARPAPSARAMALGRRVVAAQGAMEPTFLAVKRSIDQIVSLAQGRPQPDLASRAAAAGFADAIRQAFDAQTPAYREALALTYASTLSESELAGLVAFLESPAGKAWTARGPDIQALLNRNTASMGQEFQADVKRRFCLKTACSVGPWTPLGR